MQKIFLLLVCLLLVPLVRAHASSWPADATSSDLSASLLAAISDFEPSGMIWHTARNSFVVVSDGGDVAELSEAGAVINTWSPGGNWEGIAVADTSTDLVYLADENKSKIYAFDLGAGSLTGDSWDISDYVYPVGYAGLEALTWVPDGFHDYGTTVSGGVFYAGWQQDADMYVFEADLATNGSITFLEEVKTTSGYSDLSGLSFNEATGTIFTLYDGADRLEERATDGTLIETYTVPESGAWEGLAAVDSCPTGATGQMVLADDAGEVKAFSSFPFDCLIVDSDGDGTYSDTDCNDADATVSSQQTYYEDADGDGYGSSTSTTSVCSSLPPGGYTTDTSDLYDNARIEICNDGTDNDGDTQIDEANTLTENGAHVLYRDYDPNTTGSITSAALTSTGEVRITYTDGSCYDFDPHLSSYPSTLSAVAGTSYYTTTSGPTTSTLNGLTGDVQLTTTFPKLKGKVRLRLLRPR